MKVILASCIWDLWYLHWKCSLLSWLQWQVELQCEKYYAPERFTRRQHLEAILRGSEIGLGCKSGHPTRKLKITFQTLRQQKKRKRRSFSNLSKRDTLHRSFLGAYFSISISGVRKAFSAQNCRQTRSADELLVLRGHNLVWQVLPSSFKILYTFINIREPRSSKLRNGEAVCPCELVY